MEPGDPVAERQVLAHDACVDVAAGADAEEEAAARDVVEGQHLAHELHRVVVVGRGDEGAEADALGDGGRRGERRHRAEPRRLGQAAPRHVVEGPRVVEAHLLGLAPHRLGLRPRVLGQDRETESHAPTVVPNRCRRRYRVVASERTTRTRRRSRHVQSRRPLRDPRLGPRAPRRLLRPAARLVLPAVRRHALLGHRHRRRGGEAGRRRPRHQRRPDAAPGPRTRGRRAPSTAPTSSSPSTTSTASTPRASSSAGPRPSLRPTCRASGASPTSTTPTATSSASSRRSCPTAPPRWGPDARSLLRWSRDARPRADARADAAPHVSLEWDERGGVTVHMDGSPQSHVQPDDPTLLVFEYVQHLALAIDAMTPAAGSAGRHARRRRRPHPAPLGRGHPSGVPADRPRA